MTTYASSHTTILGFQLRPDRRIATNGMARSMPPSPRSTTGKAMRGLMQAAAWLWRNVRARQRRRAAIAALDALDDLTLTDIGIERSQIPALVTRIHPPSER
jgi:uncharacterized protein YjiS (DUF1127 family)